MGTYISIRGWLECATTQLAQIRDIIDRDPDDYNDGWAFPKRHINWTTYVFYGADIRATATGWFLGQLSRIAALPASDADNDRVRGLFLASHEVGGKAQWQVRDGRVFIVRGDPAHDYLDA